MKHLSTMLLLASAAMTASANRVDYCYANLADGLDYWGTTKAETYDVAVRLKTPVLTGARITGIRVAVPETTGLDNPSGWLSKELHLENKLNVPDVCTAEATIADGYLTVTFDTPYTITEEGVYAGYSLTVSELTETSRRPLATGIGSNDDSFYVHTSRTYMKWRSVSSTINMVSGIEVLIDGDFDQPSISIEALPEYHVAMTDDQIQIPVNVGCFSATPLESIDLTASAPGVAPVSYNQIFDPELHLQFGHSTPVALTLPNNFGKGTHELTLTIDKVNGHDNLNASRTVTTNLSVLSRVPVKRPLMEEYTGLWCGWCTRGFAALEYMNETYPEDFIAVAYHNGGSSDPMSTISQNAYPNNVSGFPDAYLNRQYEGDPYYGTANDGFGMEEMWKALCTGLAPVDLSGKATLGDDKIINVEAEAFFVLADGKNYDYQLLLAGNGLTDESWTQSNYLSRYTQEQEVFAIPQAMAFCSGGKYGTSSVKNLVFNDVLLMRSDVTPLIDANDLSADMAVPVKGQFNLNMAVGLTGVNLAEKATDFFVVLCAIDRATGYIVNAAKLKVNDGSGVAAISDAETLSTVWYDLQGRPAPEGRGLLIRVDRLSDGTLRTAKIIR